VCRATTGECDPQEVCDGSSPSCPADTKSPSGTACTADANPCTLDQCDGSSDLCQHPAGNAGATCRAAVNECDLAETCTGSSTTCPADAVKASGTACTDDGNACTTDLCNGTVGAPACVHAAGNAGTVCRAAANECDLAETCTGNSTTCPADTVKASGTACTDDGLGCTSDVCNGTVGAPACTHPTKSAGTVCRAATNECDLQETCDGTSTACPADTVKAAGTACTDDGNVCTTDVCNGTVGKAVVQTVYPLPDGSAIKITTARYLTPSGRDLNAVGIDPDVTVPFVDPQNVGQLETDGQLRRAVEIVRSELAASPAPAATAASGAGK
jgi:hypothetical protein